MIEDSKGSTRRIDKLLSYLSVDPDNTNLQLDYLQEALTEKEFEKSWTVVLKVVASGVTVKDERALYLVSTLAMALGNYEEATSWLKQGLDSGFEKSWVVYNLCYSFLQMDNYLDAEQFFNQYSSEFADDFDFSLLGGRVLLFCEKYKEANESLLAALKVSPGNPEALGLLSLVLLDKGELKEAEDVSAKALDHNPVQTEALITSASVHIANLQANDCLNKIDLLLAEKPNVGRAISIKGQALLLNKDYEGAKAAFEDAVKSMPNHIGTWHAKGWNHLLLNEVDKAALAFKAAYDLDHNFGESHGAMALISYLQGNQSDCEWYLQRAVRLDKNGFTAQYVQSILLQNKGDNQGAERIIEDIIAKAEASSNDLSIKEFIKKNISNS